MSEKHAAIAESTERYNRADSDYKTMLTHLKELMKEAETIAPAEEWRDRLAAEDVPHSLEEVENEMDEAELKVLMLLLIFHSF